MQPRSTAGLGPWVDDYHLHLRSGHVTASTRAVYERAVRQFVAFLREAYPDVTEPAQVTHRHVEAWLRSLTETGRRPATRAVRLKAISGWFKWIMGEADSGLTVNPAIAVPRPRVEAPLVEIPPDEALRALLGTVTKPTFLDRRDAALIRLLADAGLRRSEAVGLDLGDLDLTRGEALVRRGKGGRARRVVVSAKTALALARYARVRGRHPAAQVSPALFLSTRADRFGDYRLTGGAVAEMLRRRCRAAGIPAIHPHQLRHAATHALLEAGASEQDVERLMGWTGGTMVRRYGAALADRRAREAARRLAIGDRL